MDADSRVKAVADCEALCHAYGELADAGHAEAFADLYTPDGVFDRLGQLIKGREALRNIVAERAPGVWTRHHCSNVHIDLAADGRTASGQVDLALQRGREGVSEIDHLRARYHDRFVLTELGWRFASRKVVLVP